MKIFETKLRYASRKEKALYVFDKYKDIISVNSLDVGADKMHLKRAVENNGGKYTGVGLEPYHDHIIDLEVGELPFDDGSFEAVLCLDVLEHLESIHKTFSELCRVSNKYVVISLPNAWNDFFEMMKNGDYRDGVPQKFYGLPVTSPDDRHRWFFGIEDARRFIEYNAKKNNYTVMQIDCENERPIGGNSLKGAVLRFVLKTLFRNDINELGLSYGSLWCVLEKKNDR